MADDKTLYRLYQAESVSGGKVWGIGISEDGNVRIRYGAIDKPARLQEIPVMSQNAALAEVRHRTAHKLKEGYVLVGDATIEGNRLRPKETKTEPAILWEAERPVDKDGVLQELKWIVERLNECALPSSVRFDPAHGVCIVEGWQIGTRVIDAWEIGYSDRGGFSATGRGGGKVRRADQLIPMLILLRLFRTFRDHITLSDALGEQVLEPTLSMDDSVFGAHIFDHELVQELGSKLELCLGRMRLLDLDAAASKPGLWL